MNEPWWPIPMAVLHDYYQRSNSMVQQQAPHWLTLLHDSFRLTHEVKLEHCFVRLTPPLILTFTVRCGGTS